jgi:ferrous iron transport protein A
MKALKQMGSPQQTSLDLLVPGSHGVVRGLRGGREYVSRLAAMGLTIGCEIEMLQNRGYGPLLIRVRDTRLALGRGEAGNILVEERIA